MEAINAPPVSIHDAKYDKVAHHYELKQYYTCEYHMQKRCQTSEGILLPSAFNNTTYEKQTVAK